MENSQKPNKNQDYAELGQMGDIASEHSKKSEGFCELDDEVITIDIPSIQQQVLLTTFPTDDTQDISVEVLKYISQTSYLLLETEVYTLKITNHTKNTTTEQTRNNNDFNWLGDSIRTKYPGIGLPVHQIAVCYDAAQEKILTAELFLRFLLSHQVLKHCPEIKFFLKDSISYLQYKKLQQMEKSEEKKRGGLSISKIQNLFKSVLNVNQKLPLSRQNDKLGFTEFMEQQVEIREARDTLNKILQFRSKSCDLNAEVFKNQATILNTSNDCQELSNQLGKLKGVMSEGHQSFKKQIVAEYLRSGIFIQLVSLNLTRYLEMFNLIRSLEESMLNLKHNREFGQMYEERKYLQLLKSNLKRDIKGWLDMNNRILNQALI